MTKMINYIVHRTGELEYVGTLPEHVVRFRKYLKAAGKVKIFFKHYCPFHRYPCRLYFIQFSNNGWNAMPGSWHVSSRMLEVD